MIDLGGIYPAAINLYDVNGAPTNASQVTLTITQPDGTVVQPTVVNPPAVTGQYQYLFVTSQTGRHVVRWVTVTPQTAFTDVFDVDDVSPPSIISLHDIKQQLGIDQLWTADDDELRAKLYAITRAVEDYKHEVIVPRQFTEEQLRGQPYWYPGRPPYARLRLWRVPVLSLQSVVAADASFTWNLANLKVDGETGLVRVISGPPLRGDIITTYTAGYTIIPYNYIEGAKVLFQHEWETRRGPGALQTGGAGVIGREEFMDWRRYESFPRKVREWLGPPRVTLA